MNNFSYDVIVLTSKPSESATSFCKKLSMLTKTLTLNIEAKHWKTSEIQSEKAQISFHSTDE